MAKQQRRKQEQRRSPRSSGAKSQTVIASGGGGASRYNTAMPKPKLFDAELDGKKIGVYETERTVEIFAEGVHGLAVSGPMIKVNFFTRTFPINGDSESRDVAVRLVLPLNEFASITELFRKQIETMIADGLIAPILPKEQH